MIVVSLLFIGGAVVLLMLGLWQPSSALLSASIGASLLAAVVLAIGARRVRPTRGGIDPDEGPRHAGAARGSSRRDAITTLDRFNLAGDLPAEPAPGDRAGQLAPVTVAIPPQAGPAVEPVTGTTADRAAGQQPGAGAPGAGAPGAGAPGAGNMGAGDGAGDVDADYGDDEDPPDEPAPQQVSAADAARVGRMSTEVLVVDGRPRYHVPGCVHLLGRESEPLPVSEAVELGFTPCSLCEPDSALLAGARRV